MPTSLTRRNVGKSLLTVLAAGAALPAATKRPLGFQLYTIRNLIPDHAREALERVAKIGYREIETSGDSNAVVLPLCKEFGLSAVSAHYATPLVTGNFAAWKDEYPHGRPPGFTWEKAVDEAAKAGARFMVIAYLNPAERGSIDDFRRYADLFNQAGETARKAGLRLCYHNHAFDFGPRQGSRSIDVFAERFDPKLVGFEMDVFWVSVAGEDPVALLGKWKGRVPLLHLKDKAPGLKRHFSEDLAPNAFREVGLGVLDFSKILPAARAAGVEHYFVEQDEVAEDPVESLAYSYRTLEKLGL